MESSLRSLLAAHDNAVLQIVILDREMHSLMLKMVKQLDEGHIIHGMQLAQRRCIMEGVRQMFQVYQENKWRQVQQAMRNTVHQMSAEAGRIRGSEEEGSRRSTDDQEVLEGSQADDPDAWQMSSEQHLQQMMREAREIRGSDEDENSEGSWSDDSNCSDLDWSGDRHLQLMLQEAQEIRGAYDQDQMSDEQQTSIDDPYDETSELDVSSGVASDADATFADSSEASFADSITDASFADSITDASFSDNNLASERMFDFQDSVIDVHDVDYISDASDESEEDYVPMFQVSRQDQYTGTIVRGLVLESCELHRHA